MFDFENILARSGTFFARELILKEVLQEHVRRIFLGQTTEVPFKDVVAPTHEVDLWPTSLCKDPALVLQMWK